MLKSRLKLHLTINYELLAALLCPVVKLSLNRQFMPWKLKKDLLRIHNQIIVAEQNIYSIELNKS